MDRWLIDTVRHAGQIALDFFEGSFEVKRKPDGSPVTTADLTVDRFLREQLAQRYPGDCLLSEETEDDPRRSSARRVWIIDPIDGTSYFVAGRPEFGVLVALAVDGWVEESVSFFPKMDILLSSKRGEGAFVNGRRVHVSRLNGAGAKVACKPGPFQSLNTAPQVIKNNALEVFRVVTGEVEGCVIQTSPSTC
ncbi:MAG: inositol monophosphatase family protein [Candidatus Hydrogenedentales bacterium]|jgi:myo-inositol-1(or 4)-monophosphatase